MVFNRLVNVVIASPHFLLSQESSGGEAIPIEKSTSTQLEDIMALNKRKKENILIVSCHSEVRRSLSEYLSRFYNVHCSNTFVKALKIVKRADYSVVITELDTPETKGIEVLRKFKEVDSEATIIVVTTYASVNMAVEAMKAGAYDYITKPFNLDEINMVIEHAIERHKMFKEIKEKRIYQELALIDSLTKVYNRRYFEELLRQETERSLRYSHKFSLLMLDVDEFKRCNDTHGHLGGDEVLKGVSNILMHKTRTTDYVARYGGDEFAIIAPHTDKKSASVIGTRIADTVANETFVIDKRTNVRMTVSIGITTFGEDVKTKVGLIRYADKALYQAKKLGKNMVCMFGKERKKITVIKAGKKRRRYDQRRLQ